MYCLLITGLPAAGKSTMAGMLGKKMNLPVISKDSIKERLFDSVGFQSRKEKVKLGIASMEIMYYMASQLMEVHQPFILENNFEYISREPLMSILKKYGYSALTITLTGDYKTIYERYLERNTNPDRHRGHIVNDCYPEKEKRSVEELRSASVSYKDYMYGIEHRGFDTFCADGKRIIVDTTDFSQIDVENVVQQISSWIEELKYD